MLKKCMAAVVTVLFCLSMMSGGLVSARVETVNFVLSCTDGEVGETVTLSLSIPADSYFTNATMHLHYDSTALSFIEEGVGSASAKGAMFMVNDKPEQNTLSAAYVTINGIKKGGVLLTFDFEVLKKVPVPVTLTFNECVGVDADDVEFDVKYTTEGCVVNNDGSLTSPPPSEPTTTVTAAPTTAPTSGGGTVVQPITPGTTVATQGDVSDGTTALPQTDPTAAVGDETPAEQEEEQKPVYSTVTDAEGTPVTDAEGVVVTTLVVPTQDNEEAPVDLTWVIVPAVCLAAAIVAVVAVLVIKKNKKADDSSAE